MSRDPQLELLNIEPTLREFIQMPIANKFYHQIETDFTAEPWDVPITPAKSSQQKKDHYIQITNNKINAKTINNRNSYQYLKTQKLSSQKRICRVGSAYSSSKLSQSTSKDHHFGITQILSQELYKSISIEMSKEYSTRPKIKQLIMQLHSYIN